VGLVILFFEMTFILIMVGPQDIVKVRANRQYQSRDWLVLPNFY
jgi:hypothetical protein